ncbi:MAG TPA: hypothetical protein DGT21_00565 [Armatimonadetes bacterium]|jgi:hypothetical protein|nr:hypothetical protein [Armatimonadota bacterium]
MAGETAADRMTATVHGTLEPDGTIRLDSDPGLPAGRVTVIVSVVEATGEDDGRRETLPELLDRLVAMAAERGDRRTVAEIDAEINRFRDESEERMVEILALRNAPRDGKASP